MDQREKPSAGGGGMSGRFFARLRRDGPALGVIAVLTVGVEMGIYAGACLCGTGQREAALLMLAASTLWVTLSVPSLSAGGWDGTAALLRGGTVSDMTGICLLLLWAGNEFVSFTAVLKVYCVLLAVAMAATAVGRLGRTRAGRYVWAVAASAVLAAALATPFSVMTPALNIENQDTQRTVMAIAVHVNPFYAITDAVIGEAKFIWHQEGILYDLTKIPEFTPTPAPHWYTAVVIYGLLAGVLAGVMMLRRRRAIP